MATHKEHPNFMFKRLWVRIPAPDSKWVILHLLTVKFVMSFEKRPGTAIKKGVYLGGSPGLVVMGGDLCSKGCGFESWRHIMDGHNIFSHKFVVRIVMFVWKDKNKRKTGQDGPFFIKIVWTYYQPLTSHVYKAASDVVGSVVKSYLGKSLEVEPSN